ncbi:helix-turn-helix transcriptional regulator [Micromonospora sp. NPDC048839]|uniref:helix-turn-helix domain-containing protein n=1 Tax=Micromonospora sp. NPDC048839 TaxID=3155641 RepID=UPI0033E280B6
MTERGVAYDFWVRVRAEQNARGWTDDELRDQSGIARTTVDRLQVGKRPPTARTVNALSRALGIDETEAHQLAGRLPRDTPASGTATPFQQPRTPSVREAILADPIYDDDQRRAMLQLIDIFEQANRNRQD